jgi:hypothetical protein
MLVQFLAENLFLAFLQQFVPFFLPACLSIEWVSVRSFLFSLWEQDKCGVEQTQKKERQTGFPLLAEQN